MTLQPEAAERAARNIALRLYKLGRQPKAKLTPNPRMPWFDRGYLERASGALRAHGFRDLGCYRLDAGAGEAADGLRYRLLVSADGATRAAVAVVRAQLKQIRWPVRVLMYLLGRVPRPRRVIELTSTLSNGAVINTSNSGEANPFSAPPDYDTLRLPTGTTLEAQLASHRQRTQNMLARDRSLRVECITDFAGYERLRDREREHRNAYRQMIGYVTVDELRALTKQHFAQLQAPIFAELRRLQADGAPH